MTKSFSDQSQILLRAGVRCSLRRQPAPSAPVCATMPGVSGCQTTTADKVQEHWCWHLWLLPCDKIYGTLPSASGFTFSVTVDVTLKQIQSKLVCQFSLPQPYMLFLLLSVFFNLIYSFFTEGILGFLPHRL